MLPIADSSNDGDGSFDILSNHSPDEEYLGEQIEAPWAEDAIIKAAFERFSGRLKELEGIIDERNAKMN
ncbi:hypothetical protein FNV43_RR09631 [Rhamnella rubrinervis]|uniref:Lipoxygenase domain-containing protein n=1 Tax=Rhamnella rubrinervis TaxID=2594499 RepID=A0A8K0HB26_9ROSA|nr:hypothetical protein FNV43_RR09631 [Rhamnella rubrinervis]